MDPSDLRIDETKLSTELSEQSAKFLYVAEQAVTAEKKYRDYKLKVEILEATLSAEIRDNAKKAGEKSTEKSIQEALVKSTSWQSAQFALNQLYADKESLKAAKEAWYMRKDLLVQTCIKQRCELESLGAETISEVA